VPDRDRIIDWLRFPSRSALLGMAVVLLAADQTLFHAREGVWYGGPLDETAHFLTGAFVLAALRGYVGRAFAVGLLASSVLIDVDHIPGLLGARWITHGTPRPYPHSLFTIVLVTLLALVWRSRRSLLLGVILGLACHFFRDMSESKASGVSLFWPWSDHSYGTPHWAYLASIGVVFVVSLWRARAGLGDAGGGVGVGPLNSEAATGEWPHAIQPGVH
jgi:membrane-bound metal-dependent hydrolase YbcI (DUF457 family)